MFSEMCIRDRLGVSRAAIWKAVTALRTDGTPIEAITNRGYALPHGADLLNADAITDVYKRQLYGRWVPCTRNHAPFFRLPCIHGAGGLRSGGGQIRAPKD